jgi:hypothetical protein
MASFRGFENGGFSDRGVEKAVQILGGVQNDLSSYKRLLQKAVSAYIDSGISYQTTY